MEPSQHTEKGPDGVKNHVGTSRKTNTVASPAHKIRSFRQLREIRTGSYTSRVSPRRHAAGSSVWTGMGWGASNPTPSPTPVLVTVLVCLTVWGIGCVQGCPFEDCWDLYQISLQDLNVPDENPLRGQQRVNKCTALRTLMRCLENITSSCPQDMNFWTARSMAGRHLRKFKCRKDGPTHTPLHPHRPYPDPRVCSYQGEQVYKHCALFGDPHLRTFGDEFQTCRVQGAWTLVDNDYFVVQVTNAKVVDGGPATATSMLTVIIRRNFKCGSDRYYMYEASSQSLPSAFSDGSTHFGPENSVTIQEVELNKHVEIYMRFIDTTIVVRQVGKYFTFAIKMPVEFVNQSMSNPNSMELCAKGCPTTEQISLKEVLAQRRQQGSSNLQTSQLAMSRPEAVRRCQNAKVVDFYFDSCVFDLMTTGDANFTLSAYSALHDMLRLHPASGSAQKNRTSLPWYAVVTTPSSAAASPHRHMQYKFSYILMALCTLLTWSKFSCILMALCTLLTWSNTFLGVYTNHETNC